MSTPCYHFKFILFVTGKGEKEHLAKMFSALAESGICTFVVKEFVDQRRPIRSTKRKAMMVRTGQHITDKDFEQIGAPARRYVDADPCNRVMLIDDLEWSGQAEVVEIFERYRAIFDAALGGKKDRVSVHFLVNMLESYFFAHPNSLNIALELESPVDPYVGDVESIRNPKNEVKKIFPAYSETYHSGLILDLLDLDIVLGVPEHCASLRTCVKWIFEQLKAYPDQAYLDEIEFEKRFHLLEGILSEVTVIQCHP